MVPKGQMNGCNGCSGGGNIVIANAGDAVNSAGWEWLIRSHSSARFFFELSRNLN